MSAVNNKVGFQFQPVGPKIRLSYEEAKKRHLDNLNELDKAHKELKRLLDELENLVK